MILLNKYWKVHQRPLLASKVKSLLLWNLANRVNIFSARHLSLLMQVQHLPGIGPAMFNSDLSQRSSVSVLELVFVVSYILLILERFCGFPLGKHMTMWRRPRETWASLIQINDLQTVGCKNIFVGERVSKFICRKTWNSLSSCPCFWTSNIWFQHAKATAYVRLTLT